MKISPEDFVRAWQAASSAAEVAGKLDLSITGVHSRAGFYRKKGVRLKYFRHRLAPLDVDALNAIIDGAEEQPAAPNQRRKKLPSE
jgi:cytochrome c-type biogenesis protein CcmH/NrfG